MIFWSAGPSFGFENHYCDGGPGTTTRTSLAFQLRGELYNPYMRWLMLSVSLAANLSAQPVVTGTIAGTITDPDGRSVPRIPVQAANVATKVVYRATASAAGEYSIAQLPAGTYQLTAQVSTAAFRPFVRNDLRITPGQTVKLDIRLEEGIALNTLGDVRDFFQVRAARSGLAPPAGAAPRMPDGKPDLSGYWAAGGFGPGAILLGAASNLGRPNSKSGPQNCPESAWPIT